MNGVAIAARGLSKRYQVGRARSSGFPTLRDELAQLFSRRRGPNGDRDVVWALKDVDFEIERGTAVGLIGPNGAGKTTLLKILSRITPPATGEVRVAGRVGALLEVGSGFHPELTGRENVYLNGAILGMGRREIERKFDEIVGFAEIERFIDTPVKRYSSGMFVRLAFAVAAYLETDILIVDEILAVGDLAFQRKCLGKMGEASGHGRTVLLVSHNVAAIRSLTTETMWLDRGRLVELGPTERVVARYLESSSAEIVAGVADLAGPDVRRTVSKPLALELRFEWIALLDGDGIPTARVPELSPLRLAIGFRLARRLRAVEILVRVRTTEGTLVFSCFSGEQLLDLEPGSYALSCRIPSQTLRPRRYVVELAAVGASIQDIVPSGLAFDIEAGHLVEENPRDISGPEGLIRVDSEWGEILPARDLSDLRYASRLG